MTWKHLLKGIKRRAWVVTAPEKWMYRHALLSTDRLLLPDVLGIGVARAGTTWLYRNLRAHPQVQQRSTHKEVAYFDLHFGRPLLWYSAQFNGGEGIRVDMTPGYANLPIDRIEFIRALMPDVKFILLFRNPMDQAWSETIRRLVKHPGIPLEEVDENRLVEVLRRVALSTDYMTILDRWEPRIPAGQLFIGHYEWIGERPQGFLRQIFEFIGIDTDVDWEKFPYAARMNANPPSPMPPECRAILQEINRPRVGALRARFGATADRWFKEFEF